MAFAKRDLQVDRLGLKPELVEVVERMSDGRQPARRPGWRTAYW